MKFLLEKYSEEVSRCVKCGVCQFECPTYGATGNETMVARGRLALIEGAIEGKLNLSEKFEDILSKCTSCLSCVSNCPRGIDPVKIINAAKSAYYDEKDPALIQKMILKYLLKNDHSLFSLFKLLGMANKMFYARIPVEGWLRELLPFVRDGVKKSFPLFGERNLKNEIPEIIKTKNPKMRVVFFTGCMTDFAYQETGHAIINILSANNIETIIPKDVICCGAPAYYMGDHKTALSLAKRNYHLISRLNPNYIIVNCATCGKVLKSVYSLLLNVNGSFSNFSEKVIDIHKFLYDHIGIEGIAQTNMDHDSLIPLSPFYKRGRKVKITYHDPCHLKRGQNVHIEPREILKSLPWIEFVEMDNSDTCCGGAGGFNIKHYDLSLEIGKKKAYSIKETGADIVATGCPSCQMQIMDVLNRTGYNRPVIHTMELLKPYFRT